MPQQVTINVPLDQLKDVVCACGQQVFTNAFVIKQIPAIYSPSGKPEMLSQPIGFICVSCGLLTPLNPTPPTSSIIKGS